MSGIREANYVVSKQPRYEGRYLLRLSCINRSGWAVGANPSIA